MSYKVEIAEKKDPIKKLETSKSSTRDLFSDLLNETKGFKYQITLKVMLKNFYFNSTKITVINHIFSLKNAFQEIFYMIDNGINEGSGWIVELIESHYINVSNYRPLSGSSYMKLPVELRSSKKGLINIKNNDQKCFLWCHVRHINPVKIHPERITWEDKKLANDLVMMELNFPCEKKILARLKRRTFALTCFVMKTS